MTTPDINSINATYFALSTVSKIMIVTFDKEGIIKLGTSNAAEAFRLLSTQPYVMYNHVAPQQGSPPILYIFKQDIAQQFQTVMAHINEAQKKELAERQKKLDELKIQFAQGSGLQKEVTHEEV